MSLIDKDIPNIKKLLEDNLVLKIVGPSGSGKTTTLPINLSQEYNIVVVVSNDSIASSLNNYVNNKKIHYISSKEFLKKRLYPELLIIDEIDTVSTNNFIIMSLWRNNYSDGSTKLMLLSNINNDLFPEFPTYLVEKYINNTNEIRYLKNYNSFQDSINDLIDLIYKTHNSSIEGDFLVFVLGEESVNNIIDRIENLEMDDVIIYPAYDNLSKGEIDRLYQPTKERKIIVATNIAKTSIGLEFGCIIDTMRELRMDLTIMGGYRHHIKYISRRDAFLRSTRGSKRKIIYRMISEDLYNNLPESTPEELYNVPLHYLMIDLYLGNFNPFDILNSAYDSSVLNIYYDLFIKHGILDVNNKITDKGKFIRGLPFTLKLSILSADWILNDYPIYPIIVLSSLLDNYQNSIFKFLINSGNKELYDYEIEYEEHIANYFNRFRGKSDIETYLNLWDSLMAEVSGIDVKSSIIKEWCEDNYIDYNYINNVKKIILDVVNLFKNKGMDLNIGPFDVDKLIVKVNPIITNIYEDKVFKLTKNIISAKYDDGTKQYVIDTFSINTIDEKRPKEIYALLTSTINSSYGDFNTIPISYVELNEENQKFYPGDIVF